MSKNLKCPVCQKGTIMFKENLSCECSQCRFQCHHGQIERIAAAMELAKADGEHVRHSDYKALLARHNALREAVAWERECCQDIRPLVAWARLYMLHGEDYVDAVAEALREIQDAARAEVDRLISGTPAPETQEKPC